MSCSLLYSKFFKPQVERDGSKTGSGALGIPGLDTGQAFRLCPAPHPRPSPSSRKESANYREAVMKLDTPPPHKHRPRRPEKGLPNRKLKESCPQPED